MLCCCNVSVVISSGVTTLGSRAIFVVGIGELCLVVGGVTLGAVVGILRAVLAFVAETVVGDCVGMFSTRCNCLAMSRSALRTGSPACRLGTVFFGG